ncbi:MAG: 2-oxo acid dehydrogenase subunit E2 [Bacteroidia bacterium]|nr:2-oxo acid dehydrogenase subunit E2 [Bacteroidia bacterium]
MPSVELIMPKMGESIMEATILNWLKNEGDSIELDEAVLEIATDKVDSEIPSPFAGVLVKKLHEVGDVVEVGKAVAIIETSMEVSTPPPVQEPVMESVAEIEKTVEIARSSAKTTLENASSNGHSSNSNGRFYSPLVLNIAKSEGISMNELETIPGSGKGGRVSKKDMMAYLTDRSSGSQTSIAVPPSVEVKQDVGVQNKPAVSHDGNVEIVEMDRMRKLIAKHMTNSKQTSAHVTSFVEADVTNLVLWRDKVKGPFQEKYNEKLTFTPLFMEALIRSIQDFPNINASLEGDNLIIKKDINIGMATALPSGNLIVPVIRNADQLNLLGLTKRVNDLAARARQNKLKPDEIEGGTYTISNVGTFGNVMGTPIINQPQLAIMAVGAIRKKPVVIETKEGDTIGIRHMMFLSHSYDHRVIDGFLGGSFVRKVADYLEGFDINRGI